MLGSSQFVVVVKFPKLIPDDSIPQIIPDDPIPQIIPDEPYIYYRPHVLLPGRVAT